MVLLVYLNAYTISGIGPNSYLNYGFDISMLLQIDFSTIIPLALMKLGKETKHAVRSRKMIVSKNRIKGNSERVYWRRVTRLVRKPHGKNLHEPAHVTPFRSSQKSSKKKGRQISCDNGGNKHTSNIPESSQSVLRYNGIEEVKVSIQYDICIEKESLIFSDKKHNTSKKKDLGFSCHSLDSATKAYSGSSLNNVFYPETHSKSNIDAKVFRRYSMIPMKNTVVPEISSKR